MNKIYTQDKLFHSQVIRQGVKAIKSTRNNPLKELIGIEKSLTGTVGLQVDEIYRLVDYYRR